MDTTTGMHLLIVFALISGIGSVIWTAGFAK